MYCTVMRGLYNTFSKYGDFGVYSMTNTWGMELAEVVGTRANAASAGILEHPMGARNLVGIGLSDQPDRLHRLADSIPWNRVLGSLKV